jgi:hypothetical protein
MKLYLMSTQPQRFNTLLPKNKTKMTSKQVLEEVGAEMHKKILQLTNADGTLKNQFS